MRRFKITHPRALAVLIACHVLWALTYPPFPTGWLVFVLFAPMFWVTHSLSKTQAFWYHFLGGLFYNGIMYYWLYNVMKVGPGVVIFLGVALLVVVLSLVNGYQGWLFKTWDGKPWGGVAFTVLWGGLEVARTMGQMSFPWSHVGYTLGGLLPLAQASAWVGVFGLSMFIIGCNFAWYRALQIRFRPLEGCAAGAGWIHFLPGVAAILLVLALGYWRLSGSGGGLSRGGQTQAPTMDVSLVQPSIEQTKKWDEKYFRKVMDQTWEVLEAADLEGTDLIVLAETAVPAFLHQRGEVIRALEEKAQRHGAPVIVGSLDFKPNDHPARPYVFYNSAFFIPPSPEAKWKQYSKLHLVPFSERLPFDNVFPLLNYVNLGEGDFATGPGIAVWGKTWTCSPSICYEVVYPRFMREIRRKNVDLMINITNDGWFGRSPAAYQHANIAKFRAIETGLPMARCANSGISLFYDAYGRTLAKTRLLEKTVLRGTIPLNKTDTLYQAMGNVFERTLFWLWAVFQSAVFIRRLAGRFSFLRPRRIRASP